MCYHIKHSISDAFNNVHPNSEIPWGNSASIIYLICLLIQILLNSIDDMKMGILVCTQRLIISIILYVKAFKIQESPNLLLNDILPVSVPLLSITMNNISPVIRDFNTLFNLDCLERRDIRRSDIYFQRFFITNHHLPKLLYLEGLQRVSYGIIAPGVEFKVVGFNTILKDSPQRSLVKS